MTVTYADALVASLDDAAEYAAWRELDGEDDK